MPTLLEHLVDDAGLFPPTSLSMPDALARYQRNLASGNRMLTHRFLVPAARLAELESSLRPDQQMELGVICAGADSVATAGANGWQRIRHVELKGADGMDDVPEELPVFIEPGTLGELPAAIEAARSRTATGVKVRCGGVVAEAFPTVDELATALRQVVDGGAQMKATAGLHSAVRTTDPQTGFEHHGFLNLLLAVHATLQGEDVAAVLAERDPETLVAQATALTDDEQQAIRRTLVSYGSCSTSSPVQQATELGLLAPERNSADV